MGQGIGDIRKGGQSVGGRGSQYENSAVAAEKDTRRWAAYTKMTGKPRRSDMSDLLKWEEGQEIMKKAPKPKFLDDGIAREIKEKPKGLTDIKMSGVKRK